MTSSFRCAALLCAALALSAPARAQRIPDIAPGTRVRVSAPAMYLNREVANTDNWQVGALQSMDGQSITVRMERDGTEYTIPISNIRDLQVSRGMLAPGIHWGADARRGGIVGASLGAAVMAIAWISDKEGDATVSCKSNCPDDYTALDRGFLRPTAVHALALTAGGGSAGALVGALIGRTRHREDWVPVRIGPAALRVIPGGGMLSLRL